MVFLNHFPSCVSSVWVWNKVNSRDCSLDTRSILLFLALGRYNRTSFCLNVCRMWFREVVLFCLWSTLGPYVCPLIDPGPVRLTDRGFGGELSGEVVLYQIVKRRVWYRTEVRTKRFHDEKQTNEQSDVSRVMYVKKSSLLSNKTYVGDTWN